MENAFLAIFFDYTNKIAELTQSKLLVVMETSDGLRRIGGHAELKQAFLSGALSYRQSDVMMDEDGLMQNIHNNGWLEEESSKKMSCVESDLLSSAQCSHPVPEAAKCAEVEFVLEDVKLENLEDRILVDDLDEQGNEAAEGQENGERHVADFVEKTKSKDGGADRILEDYLPSGAVDVEDSDFENEAADDQEVGERDFENSDEKEESKEAGVREEKGSGGESKGKGTERNTEKEDCAMEKQVSGEKRVKKRRREKNLTDGERKGERKVTPRGVCPLCGKSFTRRHEVLRHVKRIHLGLRSYPCPEEGCDYVGKTKADLKAHCRNKELDAQRSPDPSLVLKKAVTMLESQNRIRKSIA